MNRKWILLVATLLVSTPMAFAHSPAGTPKNHCESSSEWVVHDYGPVASGRLVYGNEDGNRGGDCNPGFSLGSACVTVDPAEPLLVEADLCGSNPPIADWDGHNEFAFGGAWLLVRSGDGQPSADPSAGAGTLYCFGAEGHHADYATVSVNDVLLGGGADFQVSADTVDLSGTGEGCGDFQNDDGQVCTGTCTVTFPAGLDGAYVVFVTGTAGHVESDGGGGSIPSGSPPACANGRDEDLDGVADYPADPDCTSPDDPSETCLPEGCVDLNDPDPVGEPDPDLEDPSTNAPPPPGGASIPAPEDGASTASHPCGFVHVHGVQKKSWYHGTYFDGAVWAHFHTCSGTQHQGNGITWHTSGAYIYKNWAAYPNMAKVWWGDGNYHRTCIGFQQNDGNWVSGCWKMRN